MENAQFPTALFGYLLFMMIGPIQAIPLFATATAGMERSVQVRAAFAATAIAALAFAVAVLAGAAAMETAGTARSSLIIAAGLILLLTALRNIFGGGPQPPNVDGFKGVALSPIAIPGLVTPMGVAIVILFASYFPEIGDKIKAFGVTAAILALDLLALLGASWFLRTLGTAPLVLLGAVFGVLQAAMGVEMVISGIGKSPLVQ